MLFHTVFKRLDMPRSEWWLVLYRAAHVYRQGHGWQALSSKWLCQVPSAHNVLVNWCLSRTVAINMKPLKGEAKKPKRLHYTVLLRAVFHPWLFVLIWIEPSWDCPHLHVPPTGLGRFFELHQNHRATFHICSDISSCICYSTFAISDKMAVQRQSRVRGTSHWFLSAAGSLSN